MPIATSQLHAMVSSKPTAMKRASGEMTMLITPVSTLVSSSIRSTFKLCEFMPHIRAVKWGLVANAGERMSGVELNCEYSGSFCQ